MLGTQGIGLGIEMSLLKLAVSLQPHQKEVLEKLKNTDGLLVYHGLGSGKTLTALKAVEQFGGKGVFIVPASLRDNIKKEQQKHKMKAKVRVSSYAKPFTPKPDEIVVFDEAHRMGRLDSNRSHYPDLYKGRKNLFLTGTPIRNAPEEIIPIARGLGIDFPRDAKKFREQYIGEKKVNPNIFARLFLGVKPGVDFYIKNTEDLKKKFEGKVHYYQSGNEHYPDVEAEVIEVPMSPLQEKAYNMAMKENPSLAYKVKYGIAPSKTESKRLNAFLSATRQIANFPGEYNLKASLEEDAPKINRAVEEILKAKKKDPNFKGVVYSNYLKYGVNLLEEKLKKAGLKVAKFTGQMKDKERKKIVSDYNKGKIDVLLISRAGGEGLDLKGTKLIQILEPHWNESQIEQVVGRGVRYKSHSHLPPEERVVKIQRFHAVPTKKWYERKRKLSADEYLYQLAKKKEAINQQFLQILQEVGKQ